MGTGVGALAGGAAEAPPPQGLTDMQRESEEIASLTQLKRPRCINDAFSEALTKV